MRCDGIWRCGGFGGSGHVSVWGYQFYGVIDYRAIDYDCLYGVIDYDCLYGVINSGAIDYQIPSTDYEIPSTDLELPTRWKLAC